MQFVYFLRFAFFAALREIKIIEVLYQLWFIMPQKIINYTMVNADIEIKEQTERSESMRHFIT